MSPTGTDLDETMFGTQASQYMRDRFPPQGGSNNDRIQIPKNDAEMLTFLMTQARDSQEKSKDPWSDKNYSDI